MSISEIVEALGIREILHFTTNRGLTGILASNAVRPRKRLTQDKHLEFILQCNCPDRSKDEEWLDYVNLLITSVNFYLFGISKGHWHTHPDTWWCILSFPPDILGHEGVYFATTNNIYTGVRRSKGTPGLENLFAQRVIRWSGNIAHREPSTPTNQPTCNQAEVLYPGDLSLKYLQNVYVADETAADKVESIRSLFDGLPDFDCAVKPELFSQQRVLNS